MANIKDVARLAGCGIATVSRVINKSGYVKKETREKVEKIIEELSYQPNEIARSMTRQKNHIVAFILPNSKHLFFGELLYHVEEELFDYGYKLMLCNSSEKLEKEIIYLEMLKNNRVDALILLTNNDVEKYLNKSLPIVSFDRYFDDVPFVASDNYQGGVLAAKRLIQHGCKNIMFIGDDAQGEHTQVNTDVSKRRIGFIDTLEKYHIRNIVNLEYPLKNYFVSEEQFTELLQPYPNIDGIFCISDSVAFTVIKVLKAKGKRVPEDVKVIGYDGGRTFNNLGQKITSIKQDPEKIAKAIRELLLHFDKKDKNRSVIIPVEISDGDTA
ncbi:MAG: LacI family DNA-binding transcriptional regulator [Bacilli bacterium]|nr:LacI family DNA-binding transcriptional regulator [Bacilli bacterium]MBN2876211.1 LacI family DNA-binding transcriptional regulator [Bacilli bacterium]